jgi:hypothetical protein
VHLRLAVALAALAALAALPAIPARAATPVPARPDPCTVSFAAGSDDASALYVGPTSDPDLDVTGVTWRFTTTDVVVEARVNELADRPATGWGDEFAATIEDRPSGTAVSFGYFRTPYGGGPTFTGGRYRAASPAGIDWTAYPGGPTHLVADYDLARSTVRLTIPRGDLELAFGKRLDKVVPSLLAVDTYLVDPTYARTRADWGKAGLDRRISTVNVGACDRWLARHGARPAVSKCALTIVAPTGDETSRTSDVVPTRDDSVDVARVTYTVTAKDVVVAIRVARLTERPLFGTGQGYVATFANRGTVVQFGVVRDVVTGTVVRQYGGKPAATAGAHVDGARSLVRLTVPRSALAKAFGVSSSRSLVFANPGAATFWTVNGESAAAADGDAAAKGRVLSLAACDKASHR